MTDIKKAKKFREDLGYSIIVILGIFPDGTQNVLTHGKTINDAKNAASMGNQLKKKLTWPDKLCNAIPLKRICGNCSYWQAEYHHPGSLIKENRNGDCMFTPDKIGRYEKDRACMSMEPK